MTSLFTVTDRFYKGDITFLIGGDLGGDIFIYLTFGGVYYLGLKAF